MQESGLVPPRDRLANRTSHMPVTQDGAGANANFPRESLDERAADAADRGRSRTTDDPELDATDLEDTQPEDKEPAAPRSVVVRDGSAESGTAVADALKRLIELTEGGDRPNLHELGFGGTAPFAGSWRWHNVELENSDWEDRTKSWTESCQWLEDTIMSFSDIGGFFDIGITSQEPLERLTGKRYDHPERVDQRMYGLLYVESKELAQEVEKYWQRWARFNRLPGFANDPDAAGSGNLKEGPHTIYLVYWMTEQEPAEPQYQATPPLTESEAEEEELEVSPYEKKRASEVPERPRRPKRQWRRITKEEEYGLIGVHDTELPKMRMAKLPREVYADMCIFMTKLQREVLEEYIEQYGPLSLLIIKLLFGKIKDKIGVDLLRHPKLGPKAQRLCQTWNSL